MGPFYPKICQIGAVRLSKRRETPTPFPPHPPSSPAQDILNLQKTLQGHRGTVQALCRLDAHTLASGSLDHTIKIWDLTTGTCKQTLQGHSDSVYALCRLDAHTLASGSDDQTIKVWDLTTGTCKETLQGHSHSVRALCRLDAHTLASGSNDHTIKIWDLTTATCKETLQGHSHSVRALCRLDAHTLASGSLDHTIKIWDLTTGTCKRTLQGHSDTVYALCRLDAHTLASGSNDHTIKIWDLTTGTCKQTLQGHSDSVYALCRLDAHTLASGSWDHTIKIWDITSGTCKQTLQGHTGPVWALCRLDAHTLASGSSDKTIKIWGCNQREKDRKPNRTNRHALATSCLGWMPTRFAYWSYCRLAEEFIQNRGCFTDEANRMVRSGSFCSAWMKANCFSMFSDILPLVKLRSAPSLLVRSLKVHRPSMEVLANKQSHLDHVVSSKLAIKQCSPLMPSEQWPYWGSKKPKSRSGDPTKTGCPFPSWDGNVWHIHAAVFHLVLVALSASS